MNFLKPILLIFIFLFTISCTSSRNDLRSLDKVIDRIWAENVRSFNHVISAVEDTGKRTRDVEIVNDGKSLLKWRKAFKIPETSDSLESNFDTERVISYLNEVQDIFKSYEVDSVFEYKIVELVNDQAFDSPLNDRRIMINLLLLESELFEEMTKMVGSLCNFCHTFNFSSVKDTVEIGDFHESIISIRGQVNSTNRFRYDSLSISNNGRQIAFEAKTIGSSVYTKFLPNEPGEYLISGILVTGYPDTDWEIRCGFRFPIKAVKN